jgi:hypothetical protein
MTNNPLLMLILAAAAAVMSLAIWYGVVRPAPNVSAYGIITNKSFLSARTIQQLQGGPRNEAWSQRSIKIPDSYLFDIRVDGLPAPVQYSMPALGAEKYSIGAKVRVRYAARGIPPFWRRVQVTEMSLLDPSLVQ